MLFVQQCRILNCWTSCLHTQIQAKVVFCPSVACYPLAEAMLGPAIASDSWESNIQKVSDGYRTFFPAQSKSITWTSSFTKILFGHRSPCTYPPSFKHSIILLIRLSSWYDDKRSGISGLGAIDLLERNWDVTEGWQMTYYDTSVTQATYVGVIATFLTNLLDSTII